ncbi:MAG: hypothetical protein NVSMB13_20790 [Mycobacteriales bacterium]
MAEDERKPSARDLVRKRRAGSRPPDTGRHHHMGAAPAQQPELTPDGLGYVDTSAVQLASRTRLQLEALREAHRAAMVSAAGTAEFEEAARRRDAVADIDAEIARRS